MITYISGKILKTSISKECTIDVLTSMGVGYRVFIPANTKILGDEVSLFTYHHVREDIQALYGFTVEQDRDMFESLLSVSGIGPKSALAILSTYTRSEIEVMVRDGDSKNLSKVSGLGSKGAQKIILELRGKIDFEKMEVEEDSTIKDLRGALKSLGYSGEVLKAKIEVGEGILDKNKEMNIEELLKKVLSE